MKRFNTFNALTFCYLNEKGYNVDYKDDLSGGNCQREILLAFLLIFLNCPSI
ncbi:MAG: hypothetical protein QCH96_02560 [Candidatus Thermoplasmatota archaeon]|nr:hypothetical protein [Candidatus Thermoplasmatota archaeon]